MPEMVSQSARPVNQPPSISYPHVLCLPFFTQRPFAPLPGHRFATRCRSGDTHGHCPLLCYYGLIRLLLSLTLLAVLPSSLAGLSKHAHPLARPSGCLRQGPLRTFGSPVHAPFAPPRPRSPNRIGHEVLTSHIETCWSRGFRVNETLRRKFTCVAAYFFVRQDSRTSVADYASLRLCRPTASIRLCTSRPPNRMSISLRFSSFQLIVHAELCLAYLYQYYSINKL